MQISIIECYNQISNDTATGILDILNILWWKQDNFKNNLNVKFLPRQM